MKKRGVFFLSILLIGSFSSASSSSKVRVIAENANIRLKPDISSMIIAQVPLGSILEFTEKIGEWYLVNLPPDEKGFIVSGYIHQSFVEEVEKDYIPRPQVKEVQPVRTEPVEKKQIEYEPVKTQVPPTPKGKLFSGFFLKFGWMISPDAGGFSYAWLPGLGFDIGLHRNFSLGIELQPAYRNYSEIDFSTIPLMGFVNVRGGISLGRLWHRLSFANLLAGFGAGLEASYSSLKLEGETLTDFDTKFAYHFLFGIEFDLKVLALIVEYQMTQISDPAVDPDFWQHYFLFGFRF